MEAGLGAGSDHVDRELDLLVGDHHEEAREAAQEQHHVPRLRLHLQGSGIKTNYFTEM